MPARTKLRTAIVLQGGGALGAYELGVLEALYKARKGFQPTVVAGTSIGAITAAVLAGAKDDPIAALRRLWHDKLALPSLGGIFAAPAVERSLGLFGNPGMYRLRTDHPLAPWLRTSLYDTAPLRETLSELIDLKRLNNRDIRVYLGAIDVATAEGRFFDSFQGDGLSFDHVVASGSLPPGFPMAEAEDPGKPGTRYSCWDGGLFTNTPFGPAINGLEESGAKDATVERELIVVELFPMAGALPSTLPDVYERMIQLRYASRLQLDRKFFRKISAVVDLVKRLERELDPNSKIRDDENFKEMQEHRKIDYFTKVTAALDPELDQATDFSLTSIEARIAAGRRDALEQDIGTPTPVAEELVGAATPH